MALYSTRYGLPLNMANYLNQALPDISGIFTLPQASGTTTEEPTTTGITEQLANLYPQNFTTRNGQGIQTLGSVEDFQTAIQQRQQRLNEPDKFAQFIYDKLPFLKTQSIESIMSGGAQRQFTIPGIAGILSKFDKYYDLPYGDQAFIASQMGYTDPSTGMANKDPFGINVRSAFGNYGEYSENKAVELEDTLSGRLSEKYGATYDPITGMFVGPNAAKANQMTEMLRSKQQFYASQKAKRNQMIQDAFNRQIEKTQQVDTGDTTTGTTGPVNIVDEVALTGGGGDRDTGPGPSPAKTSQGVTSAQHAAFRM